MWTVILLLWSMPLALGLVLLARIARGTPAVTERERELLFGRSREVVISLWLIIKFALLSLFLFFVGVAQGLILVNTNRTLLLLVPLVTAFSAMLFAACWVRSAGENGSQQKASPSDESGAGAILSNWTLKSDAEFSPKKAKEDRDDREWFSRKF